MADPSAVQIVFSSTKPTSLKWNNIEFLLDGTFGILDLVFSDLSTGSTTPISTTFDAPTSTYTQTYAWGVVTIKFRPVGARLYMDVSIHNTSSKEIKRFWFKMTDLVFPAKPQEYDGSNPIFFNGMGEPTVMSMSYGAGTVVFANEDVTQNLMVSFFQGPHNPPTSTQWALYAETDRNAGMPGGLPTIVNPIAPGATFTYTVSMRFGLGSIAERLAGDIFGKFARTYAYKVSWADRRPIFSFVLAQFANVTSQNPRGWLLTTIDVNNPASVAAWQTAMLAAADSYVAYLLSHNGQGMIFWDMEGEEHASANYVGDPRVANQFAPEMAPIYDKFFSKFTSAGLNVGMTIRPQQLVGFVQTTVADPASVLMSKVAYARQRWGAKLFYIDSFDPNQDLAALEKVQAAFPDVLLLPEFSNTRHYAVSAAYRELRPNQVSTSTPAGVKLVYPKAFSMIYLPDGDIFGKEDELFQAVRHGDIMLSRGWFDDQPTNGFVQGLYAKLP